MLPASPSNQRNGSNRDGSSVATATPSLSPSGARDASESIAPPPPPATPSNTSRDVSESIAPPPPPRDRRPDITAAAPPISRSHRDKTISVHPSSPSNAHVGIELGPLRPSQSAQPIPSSTSIHDKDEEKDEESGSVAADFDGTNYESPSVCPNWFRFPIFADFVFNAVRNRWLSTITFLSFLCLLLLSSSRHNANSCEGERMIDSPSCFFETREVFISGYGYTNQSFAVLNEHGINQIDDQSIRTTSIISFLFLLIGNSKRHSVLWLLPSTVLLSLYLAFSSRAVTFCTLADSSFEYQDSILAYRLSPRCVDRNGYAFQVDQTASPFDQACQQVAIATCEFDNLALSYYSDALNNIVAYIFLLTQLIFCIAIMTDAAGEYLKKKNKCYRPASLAWLKSKDCIMRFIDWTEQKIWPIRIDTPAPVVQSDPTGVESPMQLASRIESMKRQQHEAELRAEKEKQLLEILSSTFRYPIRLWLSATLLISAVMVWGVTALIYIESIISKLDGWNEEFHWIEESKVHQWVAEIRACVALSSSLTGALILYALWVAQRDFKRDCLKNSNIVALLLAQARMKEKIGGTEDVTQRAVAAEPEATTVTVEVSNGGGSHVVHMNGIPEEGETAPVSASIYRKPKFNGYSSEEHPVAAPIVSQAQTASPHSTSATVELVDPVFIPTTDGNELSDTLLGCVGFIGSYVATLLFASVMVWTVSLLLFCIIIFDPLRTILLSFWQPILVIIVTKIIQNLVYRVIRKVLIGSKPYVLRHPRLFALADFILALSGALTGPLSALSRVVFAFGSAFVQMFRFDRSIVLPPFQSMDPVYSDYTSLILSMEYQIRGQIVNRPKV